MSVLKMVLGFLIGAIACAILLALISIRSPILASSDTLATQKFSEAAAAPKKNSEQTVNKGDRIAVVVEPVETAPTFEPQADGENSVFEALPDQPSEASDIPNTTVPDVARAADAPVIPTPPEPTLPEDNLSENTTPKPSTPTIKPLVKNGNTLALGSGSSRLPSISADGSGSRLILDSERGDVGTSEEASDLDKPATFFAQNSNDLVELDSPIMSFVLLDLGTQGVPQAELLRQTLPVAYALDGSRSDAPRVAGDYRDAGFEVVAMLSQSDVDGLIIGSQAADVARAYLDAVPDALALIDAPKAKLQKSRRFFGPVLEVLSIGGHGVLSYKGGLSSANSAARSAGLKFGSITRYIGETEKNLDAIARIINRGVLDATQDGAAIIMAAATPENLAAIAKWVDSSAATKVTIAPLSSTMVKLSR